MLVYRSLSWITFIISLIILTIIPFYVISSLVLIIQYTSIQGLILNSILLVIEIIGYLFAFYLFYMISGAFAFRAHPTPLLRTSKGHPSFSVIVPSHGTPFPVLKKTLEGTLAFDYDNYEILVSDNGQDPEVTKKLKEFCEQHQIAFFHKFDTRGFKAGNINAVLNKTKGDLIVIIDSDHIPVSSLLTEFSKIVWSDNLAYVQAKVSYRNTQKLYQAANSILYSQFYEVFEAAKDQRGVVLFNGTTGCFRRDVLIEVNGFSEDTLIEDIDTTIKILSNGYNGRYLDFIGSQGLVPENAKSQISQLWRWAHGACTILRLRLRFILSSNGLSWSKKLELILNLMAFFSGISVVLLMTILATMIVGNIPYLRVEIFGFHLGFLMPTLVGISYSAAAFIAIIWEPRKESLFTRILQLIPFYLFSLGTFLFLISGVLEGLFLKNTPLSEGSVWNRQFHTLRDSLLALCFCGVLILIALWGLTNSFSFFLLGGVIGWILAPIVLLYEEFFTLQ